MEPTLHSNTDFTLRTECGKEFSYIFKAIKLVRDEKHNFHVIYKTFQNDYIYSFCNPFLESSANTYNIISEEEAKSIFLYRLSDANAQELFAVELTSLTVYAPDLLH